MNVLDYTLPNGTVLADGYRETLTLMKARQEDIGIYFCVADNNRGIGSIMIELIGGTEHVKSVNKYINCAKKGLQIILFLFSFRYYRNYGNSKQKYCCQH